PMGLTVARDILLNPLLIPGYGAAPGLGSVGSAIGPAMVAIVSIIALPVNVYATGLPLRLRVAAMPYLKPAAEGPKLIVTMGVPRGAQMLVMSAAGIIVVGLVNREGMMTTAAYGAAMQLFTYIQMPAMAIGGAVSAIAAQYIGARKW